MNFLIHWSSSSARVLLEYYSMSRGRGTGALIEESRSCNNLDLLLALLQRTFGFIGHWVENWLRATKKSSGIKLLTGYILIWFGSVWFAEKVVDMALKPQFIILFVLLWQWTLSPPLLNDCPTFGSGIPILSSLSPNCHHHCHQTTKSLS